MQIDPETAKAALEGLIKTLGFIAEKAKPKIKDAALITTEILPRISAPPTMRFRLKRSPITPPNNISATIGKIRADITMLKSLPVAPSRLSTPYARAMGERPLPTFEMNLADNSCTKPRCILRSRSWAAITPTAYLSTTAKETDMNTH